MPYQKLRRFVGTVAGQTNVGLLIAAVATGAGATKTVPGDSVIDTLRWWILASAVTTGGTVVIQGSHDNVNWATLATQAVSANGLLTGTITGPFKYYRANVTVRTDGTYSVFAEVVYKP
jgi:hypothetical protein